MLNVIKLNDILSENIKTVNQMRWTEFMYTQWCDLRMHGVIHSEMSQVLNMQLFRVSWDNSLQTYTGFDDRQEMEIFPIYL